MRENLAHHWRESQHRPGPGSLVSWPETEGVAVLLQALKSEGVFPKGSVLRPAGNQDCPGSSPTLNYKDDREAP